MKNNILQFKVPPYYLVRVYKNTGKVVITSSSKRKKGKRISLFTNPCGYLKAKLNNEGCNVHQLIGDYLFGRRIKGYTVNHIDGNKLNNSPNNLEYITIAENIRHAVKLGLHVSADPKRSGRYKDGRAIKSRIKEYKHEWYLRKKAVK